MRNIYILFALIVLSLSLNACFEHHEKPPDVQQIPGDFELVRYEKKFFALDTNHLTQGIAQLLEDDTIFGPVYMNQIMNFKDEKNPEIYDTIELRKFLTNPYIHYLYDSVSLSFANMNTEIAQLNQAFKYFKYYFPERKIPKVYTLISEFGTASFMIDTSILGIGLDFYLGTDYLYYEQFFPNYIIAKLKPEFIAPNSMKVLYNAYYGNPQDKIMPLVELMIENGKQLYFVEKMLPETAEEYKWGYSSAQLKWCADNEHEIWSYFSQRDLFYESEPTVLRKYIGEGPSTIDMPPESPANIGQWMGYRIILSYIRNNPNGDNLAKLLASEPKVILAKSKYKP